MIGSLKVSDDIRSPREDICWRSVVSVVVYTTIILARTLTPQPHNDVTTPGNQFDEGLVQTRIWKAILVLEDVDYSTNISFSILCTQFCETYHLSRTCCHDIKVAAKSIINLTSPSSNLEIPDTDLHEIQTICFITNNYLLQVEQMVVETQRRGCVGSVCPLSSASCVTQRTRDTKYCLLRLLSTKIYSFQLILQQMIVSKALSVPTAVTPESHDVITNPTIQDQRELYILSNAHDAWIQMLNVLRRIHRS